MDYKISLKAARINAELTQPQAAKCLGLSSRFAKFFQFLFALPALAGLLLCLALTPAACCDKMRANT